MSVDVVNYASLAQLERQLRLPQSDAAIGQFFTGNDTSLSVGSGFDLDGLTLYDGTRDARNIDWGQSARMPDDELLERQFYADKTPLTVFVSDIPTHERYAKTRGHEMTARAMGFVASHLLLRAGEIQGSPLIVRWTDGRNYDAATNSVRTYEGANAAKKAVVRGLSVAELSTQRALDQSSQKTGRFFKKDKTTDHTPVLERETLAEVLQATSRRSQKIADMAQFIVVSDFRSGFDATLESLSRISRNNQLITVQVTHPVLRGEGIKRGDVLAGANKGQNIILETEPQVQKYINDVQQKQAYIDAALKSVSDNTVRLDTAQPDWFKALKKVA